MVGLLQKIGRRMRGPVTGEPAERSGRSGDTAASAWPGHGKSAPSDRPVQEMVRRAGPVRAERDDWSGWSGGLDPVSGWATEPSIRSAGSAAQPPAQPGDYRIEPLRELPVPVPRVERQVDAAQRRDVGPRVLREALQHGRTPRRLAHAGDLA